MRATSSGSAQAGATAVRFLSAVAIGGAAGMSPEAWGQVTFDTVAIRGSNAPGTENIFGQNPQQFLTFQPPAIDAAGGVGFYAGLSGPVITGANDTGLWSQGGGGPLALVAREGNAAIPPGGLAGFNNIPSGAQINQSGQVGFTTSIFGADVPASADLGVWSGDANGLSLVAREGDRPPGLPVGVGFTSFVSPSLNAAGHTAFRARVGGVDGIWSESGTGLGLVALEGGPVPNMAPGVVFSQINVPVAFNGAGQTAFFGAMTGPGVTGDNNVGVWSERGGALGLVARKGDPAPGTAAGITFTNFGTPAINDAGTAALIGELTGAGVTASNDIGIFSQHGGPLRLVAREGSPAPGTASGTVFSDLLQNPVINARGQTLVRGSVSGLGIDTTNDEGIWLDTNGSVDLIVQEGTATPELGVGVRFGTIFTPALNGRGQVAFVSVLQGVGVDSDNDTALWATGLDGELDLIVREGDLFQVSSQSSAAITGISMISGTGGQDGRSTSFNDAGQLAFRLTFPNVPFSPREGVFVATLPSVLFGDYNDSGQVEQGDLDLVLQNWGVDTDTAGVPTGWINDLPGGQIEQTELDGVLQNWGDTSSPNFRGVVVPEPASVSLLVVALSASSRRPDHVLL